MSDRVPEHIKAFEKDFKAACLKHSITSATYIVAIPSPVHVGASLLISGGEKRLTDYVECCLAPHTVEAIVKH